MSTKAYFGCHKMESCLHKVPKFLLHVCITKSFIYFSKTLYKCIQDICRKSSVQRITTHSIFLLSLVCYCLSLRLSWQSQRHNGVICWVNFYSNKDCLRLFVENFLDIYIPIHVIQTSKLCRCGRGLT